MVSDKDSENKLAKVAMRCRRGMLELDVMFKHFFASTYEQLSFEKKQLFAQLLDQEDQDLFNWLVKAEVCPEPKFQDMLLIIRHLYAQQAKQAEKIS